MNLALGAVLMSALLLPGIIFRVALYVGKHPRSSSKLSFLEELLLGSLYSFCLHAFTLVFLQGLHKIYRANSLRIRFDWMLHLVTGQADPISPQDPFVVNQHFVDSILGFAIYMVLICLVSVGFARLFRLIIRNAQLDLTYEVVRLYSRWHYLFQGWDLGLRHDMQAAKAGRESTDLVWVDVVAELKECSVIYSGFLLDYRTDGDILDKIYLKNTIRRDLKKKAFVDGKDGASHEPGEVFSIPGKVFVIPATEIKNFNFYFIDLSERPTS